MPAALTNGQRRTLDALATTLLLPMAVEAGARIFAHCRVRRVRHDGIRATGVEVAVIDPETGRERGTLEIRAGTVVVAAGAVYTPCCCSKAGRGASAASSVATCASTRGPARCPSSARSWSSTWSTIPGWPRWG